MLTLDEVRARLRKSERTVRRYIAVGALTAYQPGGVRSPLLFKPDEVERFIDANKVVPLGVDDELAVPA
jgi:hypothetical protein